MTDRPTAQPCCTHDGEPTRPMTHGAFVIVRGGVGFYRCADCHVVFMTVPELDIDNWRREP